VSKGEPFAPFYAAITNYLDSHAAATSGGLAKEHAEIKLPHAQELKAKEERRAARADTILKALNSACRLPIATTCKVHAELVRLLTEHE